MTGLPWALADVLVSGNRDRHQGYDPLPTQIPDATSPRQHSVEIAINRYLQTLGRVAGRIDPLLGQMPSLTIGLRRPNDPIAIWPSGLDP